MQLVYIINVIGRSVIWLTKDQDYRTKVRYTPALTAVTWATVGSVSIEQALCKRPPLIAVEPSRSTVHSRESGAGAQFQPPSARA